MQVRQICAAAVIAMGALTMACHAGQAVQEHRNPPQYTMVSRRVLPGQTLWGICSKLNVGKEDLRAVVDRARLDNNIKDPGTLQPGRVITIRIKK